MTITITAFERSPDGGKGLARDTRVRWALEEAGQPYDVRLVSFTGSTAGGDALASAAGAKKFLAELGSNAANIVFAVVVLWAIFWANGVSHVKAVVDKVVEGSPAAAAGLSNGDEIRSIDGDLVLDQVDASLGLLDAVSDDGEAEMTVRNRSGSERTVTIRIADPALRHKLTEPYQLYLGLGFEYWTPPIPAVLGAVEEGGPAANAGQQRCRDRGQKHEAVNVHGLAGAELTPHL